MINRFWGTLKEKYGHGLFVGGMGVYLTILGGGWGSGGGLGGDGEGGGGGRNSSFLLNRSSFRAILKVVGLS